MQHGLNFYSHSWIVLVGVILANSGCQGTASGPANLVGNSLVGNANPVSKSAELAKWNGLTIENTKPAFLDSRTEIVVGLEINLSEEELKNLFSVSIDGKSTKIASIKGTGQPEKLRILPRTEGRIILAGTIQSALGEKEWDPDGESTQMTETAKGVFELVVKLPKGVFQYKVTRNGSWNENWGQDFVAGGGNISISVPENNTVVKILIDFNSKKILNSLTNPSEVKAPASAPKRADSGGPIRFAAALITLEQPISLASISAPIVVNTKNAKPRLVVSRGILDAKELQSDLALGSIYSKEKTIFRVWSPISEKASVRIYGSATGNEVKIIELKKDSAGIYSADVPGDLHGKFYEYEFSSYGERRITQDINCYAASRDSKRSMVIDLDRTDPTNWPTSPKLKHKSQTDAILYEISVRDFTALKSSGVNPENQGKYAGLVQSGTTSPGTKTKTGIDYLVDLGVTDIHLLPIQNFLTSSPDEYTWGYATNLFNVPEETYSVTPNDPVKVINEFKSMVAGMHNAGLRVVLDVVYNHTWPPQGKDSAFWQTVPYYYFRTNNKGEVLNESGVGNALNDDGPMVRKFVRDSLLYWMQEYKIDGFRFDLIGMHSRESVVDWAKAMRNYRQDVILYGEPWTGGGPTRFGKGVQKDTTVAVFNDRFRGAFRGELDGDAPGFVMGGGGDFEYLQKAVTGWIDGFGTQEGFTTSPQETVNYISAHDNLTFWDRLDKSIPKSDTRLQANAVKFAGAVVLLSQGVPFLEGGVEIGRVKGGNNNTYNSGDLINGYDWAKANKFSEIYNYYKEMISLRKEHAAFRMGTADQVRKAVKFSPKNAKSILSFTIDGTVSSSKFNEYFVIFNGEKRSEKMPLPIGNWQELADENPGKIASNKAVSGVQTMEPLMAYVYAR